MDRKTGIHSGWRLERQGIKNSLILACLEYIEKEIGRVASKSVHKPGQVGLRHVQAQPDFKNKGPYPA